MKQTIFCISLCAAALPAVAVWTVTTDGAPSDCTHLISDGNWQIGVYRYSDDNWLLGKRINANGSTYVAGSGVLDLRSLEADCGVRLKTSSNGGLERVTTITEVWLPDSLENIDGATFNNDNTASSASITNVVLGSGIKTIGGNAFNNCKNLKYIDFGGTKEQWKAITKGSSWDYNTGKYVVRCTDGNINK